MRSRKTRLAGGRMERSLPNSQSLDFMESLIRRSRSRGPAGLCREVRVIPVDASTHGDFEPLMRSFVLCLNRGRLG